MADRGDTHYKVPTLNRWFALSSFVLLIACVWMVLDDFYKPWKVYQREFRTIEIERAEESLASEASQAALAEQARLEAVLEQRQQELDSRKDEISAVEQELRLARAEQFRWTESAKRAKQVFNWERYIAEEEVVLGHEGEEEALEKVTGYERSLFGEEGEKEHYDFEVARLEQKLKDLRAGVTEVETAMKAATKEVELTRKKLDALAPSDPAGRVANLIRDDIPGLDFIGPTIKVRKAVLQDLTFELNFTKKKRIDMCMTCHMAIDREGFTEEDLEEPYRSHPRLDLFTTAKSPHPMNEMGCSICHRGSGEALDFVRADHNTFDEDKAHEWEEEYGWHKQHHWDYPMLAEEYVEASCVQCHKTSMEIIADEAPAVTEGYRTFERYGCYACHKVDWFPTKRRPGPSLKGLKDKTSREFVDSWIAAPRSFRPSTWMPQIFHLENYAPDETIVVSNYGGSELDESGQPLGREIKGQEWNDSAVAAVATYVWGRSHEPELPAVPVQGDATRGKEVFRLSGCLACHNLAPYDEAERAELEADFYADDALKRRGTNEQGPNLRGVASKVTPEWLFAWIKDPAAYWSETRMPNLRLSDQDAADIVAYFTDDPDGVFHDVPDGWAPAASPYKRDVLEEQARWFFKRAGRVELNRRFAEDWAEDQKLLEVVGEKFVLNQGCHSCHEIDGLEDAMPIGTELSNWASKTVDKLDWGLVHEIEADARGLEGNERSHFIHQLKAYREPWLERKLAAPRSFDRKKLKNPTEKLRMPWFGFDEEQIQSLVTFVGGLVDDEVQQAKMVPTADKVAMDHGLRVVRQKNCAACHVLEPGSVAFTDDDGAHHDVKARILAFEGEVLPPPFEGFGPYRTSYVDWMREEDDEFELEDVAVQLLRPEPGLGDVGRILVVEDVDSVQPRPGQGGDIVKLITDYYLNPWGYDEETDSDVSLTADPEGNGRVQDVDGEWRAYDSEPYDKVRWTYAPPVLIGEGGKLQREWFYRFLLDPQPLRQQMRVKMPTFNWAPGEAGAVADYFANAAAHDWPAQYARKLLLDQDATPDEVALGMAQAGISGVSAATIQGIADGLPVETQAGLPKLLEYGQAVGFDTAPPVDPNHETVAQRAPSYLNARLATEPDLFRDIHTLVTDGPNCVQCHFLAGAPPNAAGPIAWAPDLDLTRERLRPDWTREWLTDPGKIYPGTTMPANFSLTDTAWQEFYPRPSAEQIEAVLTWLFNLDRALIRN